MRAVDERQSLETLTREEKTNGRALAQVKDKLEQLTQKRDKLSEEERTHSLKKTEVRDISRLARYAGLTCCYAVGQQSF